MPTLSRKAKQFLIALAKLLVVGGAFYFIYDRIANNEQMDWNRFSEMLAGQNSLPLIFVVLLLTFLNRFIEILKWQNLASTIRPVSVAMATEQVLAALTAALFTPNGIGEYAAKTLYFKKSDAKTVVFLNLICNGVQLIIAVLFGLAGLIIFNALYDVIPNRTLIIILATIIAVVAIVFSSRKITIRGYSIQKLGDKINELPKRIHRKNGLLAFFRYLCIMHQHYFIFLAFGVDLPYPIMISAIAGVYFLGSSLPSFQLLDFAVRGSVAVFFFGILGVNEWIVVFAATLQWLLNIVIPVTIGSYFVFRFKPSNVTAPTVPD
ncbi:MAG: hypothetical protein EOO45_11635 [Flavobacterium sp.]|nr:MAG: hypothetical protein EOO45_11635 [Flavobacterium sp.]